jgi:ankyrin repeat protein
VGAARYVGVENANILITSIFHEVSLDILCCLVNELGADVNGVRPIGGATPSYIAAQIGDLALVHCLVKKIGADVNQAVDNRNTPLYIAAYNDHIAVVQCLVKEHGVDVNQGRMDGSTPLYTAVEKGHLDLMRCLMKDLGADVNQVKNCGATPLFLAARNGRLAVVRCLVKELGADVNKAIINAMINGVTPLMTTAFHGKEDWSLSSSSTVRTPRSLRLKSARWRTSPEVLVPRKSSLSTWRPGRIARSRDASARE